MPACAADVVAVLDSLGWQRAVVVGHSWGASVALEAAASAHDRVAAAVLVDGGLWSPSALGPRAQVREALDPAGPRHPGGRALGPDPRRRPRPVVVGRGAGRPRPDLPDRRGRTRADAARDGSAHEGARRHARPRASRDAGPHDGAGRARLGRGLRAAGDGRRCLAARQGRGRGRCPRSGATASFTGGRGRSTTYPCSGRRSSPDWWTQWSSRRRVAIGDRAR